MLDVNYQEMVILVLIASFLLLLGVSAFVYAVISKILETVRYRKDKTMQDREDLRICLYCKYYAYPPTYPNLPCNSCTTGSLWVADYGIKPRNEQKEIENRKGF